jgi:predicted outer membrane protein
MKRSLITFSFVSLFALPFGYGQTTPGSPELPPTPSRTLPPPEKTNVPGPGPGANPNVFPKEVREAKEAAEAAARAAAPAANAAAELPAPTTEAELLNMLGASNRSQLRLAKLASQRSTNPEIKTLAETMVQDLTTGEKSLSQLNTTLGFTASPDAETGSDATYERINRLNGAEFDRAYLQQVRLAQAANLSRYEAAGSFAQTRALKSYVSTNQTALRTSAQQVNRLSVAAGEAPTSTPAAPTATGVAPGAAPQGVPATPGNVPATPGNVPAAPGNAPNVNPGTAPATPGNAPNVNPGTAPGSRPGAAPGTTPGRVPQGSTPGRQPGANPGNAAPGNTTR